MTAWKITLLNILKKWEFSIMKFIDINCDMRENCGSDSAIFKYISNANIACGGHAGDSETMKKTAFPAKTYNVSTGAHNNNE